MAGRYRHSSAVTLDRILEAAREAFAAQGFDGAKLESIGKAAGVTKQLVYHYFKTKEELYGVVLDQVAEEVLVMLDGPDYEKMEPPDAVRALIEQIMQNFVERPYLIGITVDQALHKGEHVTHRSQYLPAVRKFVEGRVGPMLRRGMAKGDFRPGIDPYLFYWSIFALATASFTQHWSMSQTCGIDFASKEGNSVWRDHIVAFVLAGLRPAALPD